MNTTAVDALETGSIEQTRWRIDPAHSQVGFETPHFFGLATIKGGFERYAGTLDLSAQPAVELTIDADSLDTKNEKRDGHLRSADFFDAAAHPQVRFVSDEATFDGERLRVRGRLHAAGTSVALQLDVGVRRAGDELEVDMMTSVDHRRLGMTWNFLGMIRSPSKLVVRARLVRTKG
jgi:polyisoprenoid-binding protein YceI